MPQSKEVLAPLGHIPADIQCAQDYEALAQHFIPADRLAYIAGGSGQEQTLQANRRIFSDYAIMPRPLRDVGQGSTQCELLGQTLPHPFMLAPVAYQALVHEQAELATAQAAQATGTTMLASSLSSQPMEAIAQQGANAWFQLYFQARREDTLDLIQRAHQAGYQAIVVTVDASVQLPSHRAIRAGFQMPANIQAANLVNYQPLGPAPKDIFASYMQNTVTYADLRWLLDVSPLPVLVKGVQHADDVLRLEQLGVAGVVVSNHGGRTVDGVPASLATLPEVRQAVGDDFSLLFDGGIRSGGDIFKALALGADAVLVGRLQVYALSVAGALGVAHLLKILQQELALHMAQAGCCSIGDISSATLLQRS